MASSPKFRNLGSRPKQSPVELKEKMRKNYKHKIQNCRSMLMDKLRESTVEKDLCNTLTEIYTNMFNFSHDMNDYEECELLDELKNELVQEELEWLLKEYEKSQMDNIDWSTIEADNNVICPVCQKTNMQLSSSHNLCCSHCNINITTQNTLLDIKNIILSSVENHSVSCEQDAQFSIVSEANDSHIYLICDNCTEMKLVV